MANNATLQIQGNLTIGNENLTVVGGGATGSTGALQNVSGTSSISGGTVTLGG